MADEDVARLRTLTEQGTVVYTLKNKSQLNCLIIQNLTRTGKTSWGLSTAMTLICCCGSPFRTAIRTVVSRLFFNPDKSDYLKRLTLKNQNSIIYARGSAHLGSRYPKDPLIQLVSMRNAKWIIPSFSCRSLFPMGGAVKKKRKASWSCSSEKLKIRERSAALCRFFRYSKKAFMLSSEPINLTEFLAQHPNTATGTIAYLLRREIVDRIDREKRSIVGPVLKSREEIMGTVLKDSGLVEFMTNFAVQRGEKVSGGDPGSEQVSL